MKVVFGVGLGGANGKAKTRRGPIVSPRDAEGAEVGKGKNRIAGVAGCGGKALLPFSSATYNTLKSSRFLLFVKC